MRKNLPLYNAGLIALCAFFWIILNEELSLFNFILGSCFGFIAIYLSENYLIKKKYSHYYRINPLVLLKYSLVLIGQIFASGFTTIKLIITGQVNPVIVEIETQLSDEFKQCILANSITLTPGTLVIDSKDGLLKVLCINCPATNKKEAEELVKGSFERILLGG